MTLQTQMMRRGLPRIPGGEPWPPEASIPHHTEVGLPIQAERKDIGAAQTAPDTLVKNIDTSSDSLTQPLRQGLPRDAALTAWPPVSEVVLDTTLPLQNSVGATLLVQDDVSQSSTTGHLKEHAVSMANEQTRTVIGLSDVLLRRGLPRMPGGEAWPPEGYVPLFAEQEEPTSAPTTIRSDDSSTTSSKVSAEKPPASVAAKNETQERPAQATPRTFKQSAPQQKPSKAETTASTSQTKRKWYKTPMLIAISALLGAALIVLAVRGVTTLPGVPEFLERYPGQYERPDFVDDGFPAWARWAHYLNFFFIVLIIRSGLMVRHQSKPSAFFTPKRGGKKVSIYLWMHTSLDLLWVLNGIIFVVLLFATGSWARIVPTSWEVFPNALSAMLQYLTLQWPVEDGWSNYNSLQQLMYFTVVFIVAPLAMVSGVRMSEWWPEKNAKLNAIFPAPLARAIHYPVMLFFVLFIIFHVFLVFATGMLRNLNHMFYGVPEASWTGFWIFALGLGVVIGAVVASKPLVLAPLASVFGKVTNR